MMDERPDFVVFNGAIERYADHPIAIKVGELVRIFLVNGVRWLEISKLSRISRLPISSQTVAVRL
jgi:hypothetical protein